MHTYSTTHKQQRLLQFIEHYMAKYGTAPSYREMKIGLGGNGHGLGSVHDMLVRLEERGLIRRLPKRARAIELTHGAMPLVTYHDTRYFVWDAEAKALKPMERKP